MTKFKEYMVLNEVFNTKSELKGERITRGGSHIEYKIEFKVKDRWFTFTAETYNEDDFTDWGITFFDDEHGTDVSGKGDALVVFAGALSALKKFISKMNPESFSFTAMGKSRRKLYSKFAEVAKKFLRGYSRSGIGDGWWEFERR